MEAAEQPALQEPADRVRSRFITALSAEVQLNLHSHTRCVATERYMQRQNMLPTSTQGCCWGLFDS